MSMTLYDFIFIACDESYKINVWYCNTGEEILHQVEVGSIQEELEKIGCEDLMDCDVMSWDIAYFSGDDKEEFTINIDR